MKRIALILSSIAIIMIGYIAFGVVKESQNPERYEQNLSASAGPKIVTPDEVEAALNQWRVDHNLPTLRTNNPVLDQAAQVRAETMCTENDWTHDKAWQVLDQYYSYSFASENLHYSYLQVDQAKIPIIGWENSPGHRKTMSGDFQEAAIGVKYCPGYQDGQPNVLVVGYFGVPKE